MTDTNSAMSCDAVSTFRNYVKDNYYWIIKGKIKQDVDDVTILEFMVEKLQHSIDLADYRFDYREEILFTIKEVRREFDSDSLRIFESQDVIKKEILTAEELKQKYLESDVAQRMMPYVKLGIEVGHPKEQIRSLVLHLELCKDFYENDLIFSILWNDIFIKQKPMPVQYIDKSVVNFIYDPSEITRTLAQRALSL